MTPQERIKALRKQLEYHNHCYYVNNQPEIEDQEFDALMAELERLERVHPEMFDPNSPTQRVGSDLTNTFPQVKHRHMMLSLANTYSEEEVREFDERVRRNLGLEQVDYVCELKYDGTSISLRYKHGALETAVTRGDGVKGDDVTANVRTIRAVPLHLQGYDYPDQFEIRGEILMPFEVFNRLNEEREAAGESLFANPRNAAAGTLKLQNPMEVARRGLTNYLYYIPGEPFPVETHFDALQTAKRWGFRISSDTARCAGVDEVLAFIRKWDTERSNLPVPIDGIVVKVDHLEMQRRLGFTAKSPRWAIAYKYKAEREPTALLSVVYQVGRTGSITPVANLAPVHLSGTIVRRASIHNEEIIRKLDLHDGDTVFVEKGGEIIPKIVGVDIDKRLPGAQPVAFPTHCPECGTPLVREEGEANHYCPNSNCPPQISGKIEHFVSRKAMNIEGLGPETIDALLASGIISDIADLYDLPKKREQLLAMDRMQVKSVDNLIAAVEHSKSSPFPAFLFGLGIRHIGEQSARGLARHFKTMEALMEATIEELIEVDDIGEQMAESLRNFFDDSHNREMIARFKAYGIHFEINTDQKVAQTLEGMVFVITGTLSRPRELFKSRILDAGGQVSDSVSAKTTYLLAGEAGGSKRQKAEKLGIPILTESEFNTLIGNEPEEPTPETTPSETETTPETESEPKSEEPTPETTPSETEPKPETESEPKPETESEPKPEKKKEPVQLTLF